MVSFSSSMNKWVSYNLIGQTQLRWSSGTGLCGPVAHPLDLAFGFQPMLQIIPFLEPTSLIENIGQFRDLLMEMVLPFRLSFYPSTGRSDRK